MSKQYKLWLGICAVILSFAAAGVGYGLVGATTFSITKKFVFNFIFMTQFLATAWIVIGAYTKEK